MQTARNLRLLRHLRGYTLEELSKKAGISVSYLSRLESGSRRLSDEILLRLAKHLECEPEEIASDSPPEKQLEALGLPSFKPKNRTSDTDTKDLTGVMEEISRKLQKSVETTMRKLPIFAANVFRNGQEQEQTNIATEDDSKLDPSVPLRNPSDWVECPPELRNVKGAFGYFVVDEEMSPKYNPGDIVFIHPSKPITPGCSVLAITRNENIMVRQFKGWSGENFLLNKASDYQKKANELTSPENIVNPNMLRGIFRIVSAREAG